MELFSIQRVNHEELPGDGAFVDVYTTTGTIIYFEDNPSEADLWKVPRRTETIQTMNTGGVNIDLGLDRSKQNARLKVSVASQKFYNDINNWYMNDIDQLYILKSHKDENWIVKWKDLEAKYLGTLPAEFSGTVPIPEGMDSNTPFRNYADIYEITLDFFVVNHNIIPG